MFDVAETMRRALASELVDDQLTGLPAVEWRAAVGRVVGATALAATTAPPFTLEAAVAAAPLGDARRNARALALVRHIVEGEASATTAVPGGATGAPWAHAMGAYRFFNNADVTLGALYAACAAGVRTRTVAGARVYLVHDLSLLDRSGHNRARDRVRIGDHRGLGYELFSVLALDPAGRPLGPLVQELRTADGVLSSLAPADDIAATPFAFVDHYEQVERALAALPSLLPAAARVHVFDAEFDDLALERALTASSDAWVIRAQHLGRRVRTATGAASSLGEVAAAAPLARRGEVTRDGERVAYDVWTGETRAWFDGRSWRGRHRAGFTPKAGASVAVRVVVSELRRGDAVAFRWVLLTTLDDPRDDVVQIYLWRWRVERLFYYVKVGLRLERWEQRTGARLARRLALSGLAAMVVYQLRAALDDPAFAATVRFVAQRGGWLGRKGDALGPVVLMRGASVLISALALLEQLGLERLRVVSAHLSQAMGMRLPEIPLRPDA